MKIRNTGLGLLVLLLLTLTACAPAPEEPEEPEVIVLTYAILSPKNVKKGAIDKFNSLHKGSIRIETRDYTRRSEDGKQGADLLMVELATGKVPDIIDLGTDDQLCQLPYRQLAVKGYLEDLWPYIENDPALGRDRVMECFLRPAEVNGGLYVLYDTVELRTLMGAESVVGDRTSWSLEEMLETFNSLPNGDKIMDCLVSGRLKPSMKNYLLNTILCGFINLFVDFDSGQCYFDGQLFRDLLEFINNTPDTPQEYDWLSEFETEYGYDWYDLDPEYSIRLRKRETMLRALDISGIIDFRANNGYFGEWSVPVGYPLGDGVVGSYYVPVGSKLAMSSTCQDKDTAWEFIRDMLFPASTKRIAVPETFPVKKGSFNLAMRRFSSYIPADEWSMSIGPFTFPMPKGTPEQKQWIMDYFESITHCSLFLEPAVLEMIQEQAAAYFAGAVPLDETVDRIQSRALLYINEHM